MSVLKNEIVNDKYEIKHFIESTSFCDIYTCIDILSKKFVSLSVYLVKDIAEDDLDENGDLREIGFLKLGINGFPKLLGFGHFSCNELEYRYIATEFVSGESVSDRIKRSGPLSISESTNVILKIADIAKNLHNRDNPILLNGLSLNNIIFDMSSEIEQIKLRDLINVRFLEDDFKFEYIDGVSVNNIANECFENVFSKKTDQFNLGSLFYEMIHGQPPWIGDDLVDFDNKDLIKKHLNDRMYQLYFKENLDLHIKEFLLKSLSLENRFRNMNEFVSYLKREKILTSKTKLPKKPKIKKGNGFKDVGGMKELKKELEEKVLDVLRRPEHYKKWGVTIPNGMLLYGPPRCGKTYISEKFCEEAGFNFFLIKPSDLSSIYLSGGEEKIGQLFLEAEENAPSVICFDEVDAIMPKRSDDLHQGTSSRVNELLSQMNECSKRGIFVIATTNRPELIDPAMRASGRFDVSIYVPPPDLEAREELLLLFLKNRNASTDIDYTVLCKMTENFVTKDIEMVVNNAAFIAAKNEEELSMKILKECLNNFMPTVSKNILDKYEQLHKSFTNERDSVNSSRRIGF